MLLLCNGVNSGMMVDFNSLMISMLWHLCVF